MKHSTVRRQHEEDAEKAFHASGCTYFPGTKKIQRFVGSRLQEELKKLGHTSLAWEGCSCKDKVTVSSEQEWNDYFDQKNISR